MPSLATLMRPFERGSAAIDWCEGNYVVLSTVAEFANTLTCFYYVFFPPFLIYLFRDYGYKVSQGIHVVWALLIVVGITSAYFHATLSMVGQILDELSILWVVLAGVALWFPNNMLPKFFRRDRRLFVQSVVIFGAVGTCLACVEPAFNAFALMASGLPAAILLMKEVKGSNNSRAVRLGIRTGVIWVLAVICWLNDRMLCEMWSMVNFRYFHAIWHILIFNASYPACVLFSYFHVVQNLPETRPRLLYWPCDSFEYGIPYVQLEQKEMKGKKI